MPGTENVQAGEAVLIPRDVLFGNPSYLKPEISPDGTRLLYLAPDEGVLNVWAAPVGRMDEAAPLTRDRRTGIRSFGCCHDGRTLYYLRDDHGDENRRLYLLDMDTGEQWCATPFDGVQARVLAHFPWRPTAMLVGLNSDQRQFHDAYLLDLETRELSKVAANPGYLSWLPDANLALRGGMAPRPDGGVTIHADVAGRTGPWLEVPFEDAMGTGVIGFARDGKTLYLLSSVGANTSGLFAVDVATGEAEKIAQDPVHDVRQVVLDPLTGEPQAVILAGDRDTWLFLDDRFAAEVRQVRRELARLGIDAEVYIDQSDLSGGHWTVTVVASDQPVQYFLYQRAEGRLWRAFSHQPRLERYQLARMEPFSFQARDGLQVHGYVTWPHGAARRGLPAVVNVHGGPWARNWYGFDEEAQLLANRGYACVQVNFRGSTGYGKRFRALGAGQWGAAMHTDLLDAVAHLVADGAIDPGRIAIMGCSYGGYAALVGAAFTPDTFRCAIDQCGPANLLTLLANGAPYRSPLLAFMHANIGDPATDRDMLWERSPLSRAASIRIPVMVAQGANDVRVTTREAEQIVSALAENGVPHEYLLFPDEGHGLRRPENRDAYYGAVEAFLAAHLA